MNYCASCGASVRPAGNFCSGCGFRTSERPATSQSNSRSVATRRCPFCRSEVDGGASRCPRCTAEIGLLQNCIPCPACSELVLPVQIAATNENGSATSLAKVALGGHFFLSGSDETYQACPVCKSAISYCQTCQAVTVSVLTRKWVGLGRSRSGYQYSAKCTACGSKVAGPSCFVATVAFGSKLDANLLELYHLRDCHMRQTSLGRTAIAAYYRLGPRLARLCTESKPLKHVARKLIIFAIALWRWWHFQKCRGCA
jgi:hypothetical protein